MDATLTIRLDKQHREALRKRARAARKTESEVARELLAQGLEIRADWDNALKLKGCIKLPKDFTDPWRKQIRERDWRE